jgi:DNA repair protein RecO (recombination protein O)
MYHPSRGIVFRQVKYAETSLVVKVFTEEYGLMSFLVKGARGPKSRMRAALFQPLTILDLIISRKEKQELHHIREARLAYMARTIPFEISKTAILAFMNELLYKTVREEAPNRMLFNFIEGMIRRLDESTGGTAILHLFFAAHLTRYLGFFPDGIYTGPACHFDLQEGCFKETPFISGPNILEGIPCAFFWDLLGAGPDELSKLRAAGSVRNELLDKLLLYYRIHLPLTGEFKSHLVLRDVLRS